MATEEDKRADDLLAKVGDAMKKSAASGGGWDAVWSATNAGTTDGGSVLTLTIKPYPKEAASGA